MRGAAPPPLIAALQHPTSATGWSPHEWSEIVTVARNTNLLGLLAERLQGTNPGIPREALRHLVAARQLSARQRQSVTWEVYELARALAPLEIPIVLLKGAAYALSGHRVSQGRLFGDIDILLPRAALDRAEVRLMTSGWTSAKSTAYDQRYYRQWMHELPPMVHVRRGTMLDVHHSILPITARHLPDPTLIINAASPLPAIPGIAVPALEHLLIHSVTHLLHESELNNGLRDLFDIDGLIKSDGPSAGYWERVVDAAHALGLAEILHFGLHLAKAVIGSEVPSGVLQNLRDAASPQAPITLLTHIYRSALAPTHPFDVNPGTRLARALLYLRGHWLRMPPHLLARHLARKSLMRLAKKEPALEGRA